MRLAGGTEVIPPIRIGTHVCPIRGTGVLGLAAAAISRPLLVTFCPLTSRNTAAESALSAGA